MLMAHEGSAAFAADVTARVTGRPGSCLGTMGPGATNLTTGVGCAYLDRSPVVAVTCNVPTHQLGRRVQMVIDHHALFRPITKATCPLRAGGVATTLRDALRVALSEPPGPVHLDLPEDVALAEAEDAPVLSRRARRRLPPLTRMSRAWPGSVREARRPVAVIGASARRMRDPALLRAFVEQHQLPFATTTMAKGMIDEDHPLSIGCIERARRQVQREFLRTADLVVGIGYDVAEVEYEQWIGPCRWSSLDVERVDCRLVGQDRPRGGGRPRRDARTPVEPAGQGARVARGRRVAPARALPLGTAHGGPRLHARRCIDVARRVLPRDGILAFDVGAHTHQIASQWTAHAPGQFLLHEQLVVDGVRSPCRHRRQDRPARPAGPLPRRRRLLPDDVRRGGRGQPPWPPAANRGAGRRLAVADRNQAGEAPVRASMARGFGATNASRRGPTTSGRRAWA